MPATYTLIASNTLSSSAASVTFSSIPATYTDLVVRYSGRTLRTGVPGYLKLTINSSTTNYSDTWIQGDGSTASSSRNTGQTSFQIYYAHNSDGSTSNTFGNTEIYIPNYAASIAKLVSTFGVVENNATLGYLAATSSLFNSTSAITSVALAEVGGQNFVSGSSFFLYGIKNS